MGRQKRRGAAGEELSPEEVLRKYWGYNSFRDIQREIINSVLAHRDTLTLMPTGGGKSLTFQVPALIMEGLCIVVTPLIALMKDQVDKLRSKGILATAVHSGLSPRQIDIALDNCTYGDVKFLYIAPERLASDTFRLRLQRMNVSLLAIDEAHCISQWGYDFRPSYLQIAEIRKKLPDTPVIALTASATEGVAKDIMHHLNFESEHIIRGDFSRPNISYAVRHVDDKHDQLMRLINNVSGSGIIYMRTRVGTEELSQLLEQEGVSVTFYHGGLPHTERSIRQDEWITGKKRIIVATNAFGMGIDKPDVRFVVHYAMSDSLEAYYQEAGRAGRDGKRSYALLLVAPNDNEKIHKRFEMEFPSLETIKAIYDKICSSLQIAIGEGGYSTHSFNIFKFCSEQKLYVGTVNSAIKLLEMNGYLQLTDELENPARIMFTVSRDDLYKVRVDDHTLDPFIRTILRLYDGLFSGFRNIRESEIAQWSGYTIPKVKELLKQMWRMRIIRYVPSNRSPLLTLHSERLPIEDLYISPQSYKHRKELYEERFTHMLHYANNEELCRSVVIDEYFGGKGVGNCGVCDICLDRKRQTPLASTSESAKTESLRDSIVRLISVEELTIKEVAMRLGAEPTRCITAVEHLIQEGKIRQDATGRLSLR
ncbi:MAG: ATP-dependent DNA helicase RecQ [Rikenellaceae bacterium]